LRAALVLVNNNVPPADAADPDDWRAGDYPCAVSWSGSLFAAEGARSS
jgi:hypothetical protein